MKILCSILFICNVFVVDNVKEIDEYFVENMAEYYEMMQD